MSKRRTLTLIQKLEVIKDAAVLSQRKAAVKHGISVGAVNTMVRNKRKIEEALEQNNAPDRKKLKLTPYEDINNLMLEWFKTARLKRIPISGPILQAKAFAAELHHSDFQASNGWLQKFLHRNNISFKVLCGESESVNPETVESWKSRLPDLIDDYNADDIYNADETGLFYKALPNKSMVSKGESGHGVKLAKDRITVLLCSNLSGSDKLPPFIIGKSQRPRCFKGINMDKLPAIWRNNKKAWMDTKLFTEWLNSVNKRMKKRRRNILLFLDNAPSHPTIKLSNVMVHFFPANCTSHLQPMDQGIIKTVKMGYRKRLLTSIEYRLWT